MNDLPTWCISCGFDSLMFQDTLSTEWMQLFVTQLDNVVMWTLVLLFFWRKMFMLIERCCWSIQDFHYPKLRTEKMFLVCSHVDVSSKRRDACTHVFVCVRACMRECVECRPLGLMPGRGRTWCTDAVNNMALRDQSSSCAGGLIKVGENKVPEMT